MKEGRQVMQVMRMKEGRDWDRQVMRIGRKEIDHRKTEEGRKGIGYRQAAWQEEGRKGKGLPDEGRPAGYAGYADEGGQGLGSAEGDRLGDEIKP